MDGNVFSKENARLRNISSLTDICFSTASVITEFKRHWHVLTTVWCKLFFKKFLVSPLTVANINTCETDGKHNSTAAATQQWSSASLPLTGGFSCSYLCLPSWASTLRTCSKNVTFDCRPLFFVFRGAVPGALQGDRSWRRASRLATRVSSGAAKCLADDSAVWKELPRWRDQVRYETFFQVSILYLFWGLCFFIAASSVKQVCAIN